MRAEGLQQNIQRENDPVDSGFSKKSDILPVPIPEEVGRQKNNILEARFQPVSNDENGIFETVTDFLARARITEKEIIRQHEEYRTLKEHSPQNINNGEGPNEMTHEQRQEKMEKIHQYILKKAKELEMYMLGIDVLIKEAKTQGRDLISNYTAQLLHLGESYRGLKSYEDNFSKILKKSHIMKRPLEKQAEVQKILSHLGFCEEDLQEAKVYLRDLEELAPIQDINLSESLTNNFDDLSVLDSWSAVLSPQHQKIKARSESVTMEIPVQKSTEPKIAPVIAFPQNRGRTEEPAQKPSLIKRITSKIFPWKKAA